VLEDPLSRIAVLAPPFGFPRIAIWNVGFLRSLKLLLTNLYRREPGVDEAARLARRFVLGPTYAR
jgi:hypothetical protein